jgi:hypothetical protein
MQRVVLELAKIHGRVSAMPKFSIKLLLFAFAVLALWLASLNLGAEIGGDVRRSIFLVMFLGPAFAAVCFRGRRQMFWIGFFVVLLLWVCPKLENPPLYVPLFGWAGQLFHDWAAGMSNDDQVRFAIASWMLWTIRSVWILALAALVGFIAAYIYDQSRKSDEA